MKNASETLIPVTLELGGKDAFIVCDDADIPNVCMQFFKNPEIELMSLYYIIS